MSLPRLLPCILLIAGAVHAAEDGGPVLLKPGDLPAGEPEAVLPAGAMVHCRIENPAGLLARLDDVVVAAVHPAIVPPRHRPLLELPEPTLAFLGTVVAGAPFDRNVLQAVAGIDGEAPITATLYIGGDAPPRWIVSLPVDDFIRPTGLVYTVLETGDARRIDAEGHELFVVRGRNPALPDTVVVRCGEDRIYCCSDRATALTLGGEGPRLGEDEMVRAARERAGPAGAAICVDFTPLHPPIRRFLDLNPQLPRAWLRNFLPSEQELGWRERRMLVGTLFELFGITDLELVRSHLAAWLEGGYEVLAPLLAATVEGHRGLVLAVNIDGFEVEQRAMLFGAGVKAADRPAALSREELETALALSPRDAVGARLSGRLPERAKGDLLPRLLEAVDARYRRQGFDRGFLQALSAFLDDRRAVPQLGSRAAWTLRFIEPAAELEDDPGLVRFVGHHLAGSHDVVVQPGTDLDALASHFAARAEAESRNDEARDRLVLELFDLEPLLLSGSRFRRERVDGVPCFHFERSYRTRFGLFGYSQHELVNRTTWSAHRGGGAIAMRRLIGEPAPINASPVAMRDLLPGEIALLDDCPEGVGTIRVARAIGQVPRLLSLLAGAERVAHHDLDAYIAKVQRAWVESAGDRRMLGEALSRIPAPYPLATVHCGHDGEISLRLVGGIVYPRKPVVPVVAALFRDVAARADEIGGSVFWERTRDGIQEAGGTQHLDGFTTLIRTTTARWVETYGTGRASTERFFDAVRHPADGTYPRDSMIFLSPRWRNLVSGRRW